MLGSRVFIITWMNERMDKNEDYVRAKDGNVLKTKGYD